VLIQKILIVHFHYEGRKNGFMLRQICQRKAP